ncbi:hypothetical protein HO929_02665 [Streptococcus suis]|uniref:hypothetical protein n=1 Tax=Streptococcus suis TaxID=1307 RepID=UPI0010AAD17A|nr:hypothetical protein [Streptococcus suis]MBM7317911.1 hypothetical protein [Streptococcus suis]MBY4963566.1 ribbon-helix-helix domain-containing protein [Streptococcus suis]NQP28886.1 hypothetical protein [Streptococcus suis]TII11000.1 hypothetical protein FAJ40_01980 [Streptococcus suis]
MNEFSQIIKDKQEAEKASRATTHAFSAVVEDELEEAKGTQVLKLLGIESPVEEKNVSKSIYFTPKALANLDRAVKEAGYPNRSRFINAILEKMYDHPQS